MTSTLNPHFLSEMDATPTNQVRDDLWLLILQTGF